MAQFRILLRPCRCRHEPRQHRGQRHRRQQLELLGHRAAPTRTDVSWNATAQKLIPTSTTGRRNQGSPEDGRRASSGWPRSTPTRQLLRPRASRARGSVQPEWRQRIQHGVTCVTSTTPRPTIAFGMETQPGHGASANRGEYQVACATTSTACSTDSGRRHHLWWHWRVRHRIVGGVWDAMLGEGRGFWFFASSDWHNRGSFGPDDRRTTQDFFPGEYQRNFT